MFVPLSARGPRKPRFARPRGYAALPSISNLIPKKYEKKSLVYDFLYDFKAH